MSFYKGTVVHKQYTVVQNGGAVSGHMLRHGGNEAQGFFQYFSIVSHNNNTKAWRTVKNSSHN